MIRMCPHLPICKALLLVFPAALFAAGSQVTCAQQRDARLEKAKVLVSERLAKLNVQPQTVAPITAPFLKTSFPNDVLFAVRFRLFPVAVLPPEPLKSQNVLVVSGETITELTSISTLKDWFCRRHAIGADPDKMKQAVRAWLTLSSELKQDGFYTFEINEDRIKSTRRGDETRVQGRAVVTAGGSGDIQVMIAFDKAGRIEKIEEMSALKSGVRPICQATKLLDNDPIVRKMAEQDLLVMGRAAKPYLNEQWAKAKPALRRAIDRIWARILAENR